MNNLFSVKDQVVVITGGTGVLGKAIAAHLAEEGAKVVILGRKAEVGNAIVNEIKAKGGEAMFLVTNVLDEAILEQNLKDILAAYGRVDALLNAAGGNMPGATIAPTGNFFDLKVDEFQKVLNLNLTGTVLPTQVFLKPMVEQKKGAIVMGTEGEGLSYKTIAEADYVVRIPMAHGVDSLNVATAAAVAFWQLRITDS